MLLYHTRSLLSLVFNCHIPLLLWREKVACNHRDWENFGKEEKKSPHPYRRGDRPPETVNPRPLIDLKRDAAFSDWHLFNTATVRRLLLRCLCQIRTPLCRSIMFGMLKHHLHPGILLLFMWLCHLMEHQKVQGKPSASVFLLSSPFLSWHKLRLLSDSGRLSAERHVENHWQTFHHQMSSLLFLSSAGGENPRTHQTVRAWSVHKTGAIWDTSKWVSMASFAALARRAVKPPRCCRRLLQLFSTCSYSICVTTEKQQEG